VANEAEYRSNFNEVCPALGMAVGAFPARAVLGSGRPRDVTGGHAAMAAGARAKIKVL
jgi:hypothetical protein